MESIRIISNVDDEGKLHIPEGLALKKGRVEVKCLFGQACPVHDTGSAEQTVSVRLRESVAKSVQ